LGPAAFLSVPHSPSRFRAFPTLAFGVSNCAIDPTRAATYAFIVRFLAEMASIFPDAYIHIGGDQTPAPDWKTNPPILAFMKAHELKNSDALQATSIPAYSRCMQSAGTYCLADEKRS